MSTNYYSPVLGVGTGDITTVEILDGTILDEDVDAAAAIAHSKMAALTASEIAISDGSGVVVSGAVATYPSLAEVIHVKGVTSAIQTQMDLKAALISPSFTTPALGTPSAGDLSNCTAAGAAQVGPVELAIASEIDTGTDSTRAIPIDQFVASDRNIRFVKLRVIASGTAVTVANGFGGDFVVPFTGTIIQSDTDKNYFSAATDTAGTTGTMVVDVHLNGTTIMTTNKLDIETTEKSTADATTQPDLTTTAVTAGDILTVDVDAIHTTPANGLSVTIAIRLT